MNQAGLFWVRGGLVNFMALGDKIKHPPLGATANVMFADVQFDRKYLPSSFYRYIPNAHYELQEKINVLLIVTLVDIPDNTELYVDFWNVYSYDKDKIPDWLNIPQDVLGKYFVKREYQNSVTPLMEIAKQMLLPEAIFNKMDLNLIIKSEIKELLSPKIEEKIKLSQEEQSSKKLSE